MNNAVNNRIVAMYESEGMTAEEISMDEGLEVEVIKAALLQGSGVYRKATRGGAEGEVEDEPFLSPEQFRQIKQAYVEIALNAEDEGVRERAMRNCINEHKGRNDVASMMKNSGNINILMLNESLTKARKAIENARSRRDIILPDPDPGPKLIEEAA